MKRILYIVLVASALAMAFMADNTLKRSDLRIYMRSGNWNTGDRYTTMPVVVNGKLICPYVGSIFADPYDDGTCPAVNVYHLVRVAESPKGLDCYYDYTIGGDFMFSAYGQEECPDILGAYDGLNFFCGVYFDTVDSHRLYYPDSLLTQTFDGDFEKYPTVKAQIRYRRIHMRKERKRQVIRFGQ